MDNRNNINCYCHMGIEHRSPESYSSIHPNLLLTWTLSLYKLRHRTFPFAPVTVTTTTRCRLATKPNYGS